MPEKVYMQCCIDLALKGMGHVSPNPMVGCVIVHDDKIIGEGYHQAYGGPHAEVNAVNAVFEQYGTAAADLLAQATVYVNLEPCAHFGKTPPCADMLVKHHVKRVVIGNRDPFADVNGKGIEKLQQAGIEVMSGVLDEACRFLNRRFFTRVTQQRPYIILKWAQTADGFFAPEDGTQRWITGSAARTLVHRWRTEEDAVLVGRRTASIDDPELTARDWAGKNPLRVVIDKNLQVPATNKVYNKTANTLILNGLKTGVEENVRFIQVEDMQYYLPAKIAYQLFLLDIQSVIIEGGADILNQFIHADLWDEARIFTCRNNWGSGIAAPVLTGEPEEQHEIGQDQLVIYYHQK